MLMRFDPFRDLDRLTQNLWGNGDVRPAQRPCPWTPTARATEFVVHFDVPGIDPDSIELTVEKNVLTVSAERTRHWGDEGEEVVVAERPLGSFSRQLFLGETLDAERIEASYDNGVLTLRIPVAEAAKPRKVAITSAAATSHAISADSRRRARSTPSRPGCSYPRPHWPGRLQPARLIPGSGAVRLLHRARAPQL